MVTKTLIQTVTWTGVSPAGRVLAQYAYWKLIRKRS